MDEPQTPISITQVECSRCENHWFHRTGSEFACNVCPYCSATLGKYGQPEPAPMSERHKTWRNLRTKAHPYTPRQAP